MSWTEIGIGLGAAALAWSVIASVYRRGVDVGWARHERAVKLVAPPMHLLVNVETLTPEQRAGLVAEVQRMIDNREIRLEAGLEPGNR